MRFWSNKKATRQTPFALGRVEAQYFHICVAGTSERVDSGSAELRAEPFQQKGMSAYLVLHVFRQVVELGIEILMEFYFPLHPPIMSCSEYVVKDITLSSWVPELNDAPRRSHSGAVPDHNGRWMKAATV